MRNQSFVTSDARCCNASGGIDRGSLHYVPSFGQEGLFVTLGGENFDPATDFLSFIDLGTVSVFDPVKQEWWNQTTTGSPPARRMEFCTAGINSTNDTYEM